MDCMDCGLSLSSKEDLNGFERCLKCRIEPALESGRELVREGWGSQSAAEEAAWKHGINESDMFHVAYLLELDKWED